MLINALKEFANNQGTQIEFYEMNKDGVIISVVQKVAIGSLKIVRTNCFQLVLTSDYYITKDFENLTEVLKYLSSYGIKFNQIIPSNLGKIFSIC